MLALVAFGGWHGWQWWQYQSLKKVSVTPLVPKDALLLAELTQPAALWHQIQHSPYQKWLSTFGQWQQLQAQTDSLFKYLNPALEASALQPMPVYLSLHNSGSQGLGTVFYLPLAPVGGPDQGKALLTEWLDKLTPALRKSTRRYKGQSITDIRLNDSTTLSILATKHSWAFSLKGGLIDDVVRQLQAGETAPWLAAAEPSANPALPQLKLYTNGGQLKTLLEKVSQVPVPDFMDRVLSGATIALQDVEGALVLDGQVMASPREQGAMADSLPTGAMQMLKLVPHTAAVVMHVGQANALHQFLSQKKPNSHPTDRSAMGEGMVVYAEHPDPNKLPMLVALEHSDAKKWVRNTLKAASQSKTTGTIGKQEWFLYNAGNPATPLLGYAVQGMEEAYITVLEDRWVLAANTLPFLQQVLEDYANAETWDLNEEMRGYLQNLEPNHKALFMVNPARTAQQQRNWLKPEWLEATMALSQPDTGLGTLIVQLYGTEQQAIGTTKLRVVVYPQPAVAASTDEPIKNLRTTTLPGALVGGPRLWRSETDRGLGVVVADSTNTLYWIDKKGKVQHTYALRQPLVAEPRFSAPKEQYALSLGAIHAFSFEGKAPTAWAWPLPDSLLPQYLRRVNMGASTTWMVSTAAGQVFGFMPNVKKAEFWNQGQPYSPLVAAPEQYTIQNQPVVVALERQGRLHVWQPNGEALPGFPIKLAGRVAQAPFVVVERSWAASRIAVLTEQGVLQEYDFTGALKRNVQFLRTSGKCKFNMAIEPGLQTYSVLVQDGDSITAYDPAAVKIAQLKGPGYGTAEVQYYYFGAGNEVWAVRQPTVNLLWLHTRRQVLGGGLALNSTAAVNVLYSRASRAWFVLRNAGHATYLTALRNKAWPGVRASAVFVDALTTIDSTRAPIRVANGGEDEEIPTLPYQPNHPLILHPNGMEAPGLSGRALTQLTLAYLLLNRQQKLVPAVVPPAPKPVTAKPGEKPAAKAEAKAAPAAKTTKADPKAAAKDKAPAKKNEEPKAGASTKPATKDKAKELPKEKAKAKEKPAPEAKQGSKTTAEKEKKASTKSTSTAKEKASTDKKATTKTVTSTATTAKKK